MEFGYARVSTSHQNTDRQIEALLEYGIPERNIIVDKQSGKDFERVGYLALKNTMLRAGDTLVIKELDRLGRNKQMIKEELEWLKAHEIRVKILNVPTSLMECDGQDWILEMVSNILIEVMAYCSCGYCLSRQYTHTATETKSATYRYKCRWQVDHASKYTIEAALKENNVVCDNPAVSDVKLWLCEKQVFSYMFKNGKSAVLQALEIIQRCKQDEEVLKDGTSLQTLESRRDELKKKRKKLLALSLEDDYDMNDYKELKAEIDDEIATIDDSIAHFEIEKAKQQKKAFNIEDIRQRLNTIINLRDYKVSDEVIDMFVERIIYRGVVDGNDEFVWVMNLSRECTDTSAKYKIRGYDKNYADSLKSDKNFNIVARMLIPMEECKRFCQEEAGRRFKKKYWNPITIKIAIA